MVASFAVGAARKAHASLAIGVQQTIVAHSRQYNALYRPFFMDIV